MDDDEVLDLVVKSISLLAASMVHSGTCYTPDTIIRQAEGYESYLKERGTN